jgi:hypothetical protein
MSFDVRPTDTNGTYDASGRVVPAPADEVAEGRFARVYELEQARGRHDAPATRVSADRIPDEVWDEVDAAARLVEQLETEGKRMMFDTDRLSGRVVASLLHPDGEITPLALTDAVTPERAAHAADGGAEVA